MNICSVGWISSLNNFLSWHISRSPRCFFRCKRFTHWNPTCLLVRVEEFLLETSSISPSRSIEAAPAWYLRPTWIATSPPWPASFEPLPMGTATKLGHNAGSAHQDICGLLETGGIWNNFCQWLWIQLKFRLNIWILDSRYDITISNFLIWPTNLQQDSEGTTKD